MAEETLVESLVKDSVEFVKALDIQGDRPTNVLWYYYTDADEWRLLVAGPAFDALLPKDEKQAYQKVAKAIGKAAVDTLTIADVKLARTDDHVLTATRSLFHTPRSAIVRAHFRDNTINGLFVKEMLALRAS